MTEDIAKKIQESIVIDDMDLDIDQSITDICKLSNSASSMTRGLLYFIILVSVLAFIEIENTNNISFSWNHARLLGYKKEFSIIADSLKKGKEYTQQKRDSLRLDSELVKEKLHSMVKQTISDITYPSIPVLGISYDVNDLGILIGIVMNFLMLMHIFTINRERYNLRIAFKAITERYKELSVCQYLYLKECYSDILNNTTIEKIYCRNLKNLKNHINQAEENKDEIYFLINCKINYIKRKYYYNFLTMNEVLDTPKIMGKSQYTITRILPFGLYLTPLAVFGFLVLNDFMSIKGLPRYILYSSSTHMGLYTFSNFINNQYYVCQQKAEVHFSLG